MGTVKMIYCVKGNREKKYSLHVYIYSVIENHIEEGVANI